MKQQESLAQKSVYWMKVISLGLILGIGIQFAQAWTPPGPDPPTGNVSGPLTRGDIAQYKTGMLGVNSITAPINALEVGLGGNVLVGGGIYAAGSVNATNVNATSGTVTGILASGKVQLVDVVTENTDCSPNGLVARDSTGLLLCVSGTWKNVGGGGGGGSGGACAAENTMFTLDGAYQFPQGITRLVFEIRGAGGGAGGSGAGGYAISAPGGNGGNTCLFRDTTLVGKANGGAGSGSGTDIGIQGGGGALNTELVEVTPGEIFTIKVGGGGGGGGAHNYLPYSPPGGIGEYTGATCQNSAGSGGYMASGGSGPKKGGGGGNGAYPSSVPTFISSGSGGGGGANVSYLGTVEYSGGGCESAQCFIPAMLPTNGFGGHGGSILVRTPTASELTAAGLSTYCAQ